MGTLFNQPPREYLHVCKNDVVSIINDIKEVCKETDLDVDMVVSVWQIAEQQRQNNLYKYNGDIFDEQMAGIGELFKELNLYLSRLTDIVDDLPDYLCQR